MTMSPTAAKNPHVLDRDGMARLLRRVVSALYQGQPVPPIEGGRLFREICEERRRNDDLFWTERRVNELAAELGYWPWNVAEVQTAVRAEHGPDPVMDVETLSKNKAPASSFADRL